MMQQDPAISAITPLILAGGLGTRLRPALGDRPKPLAPVNQRPFLSYLFEQLLEGGFDRAVLCTGYRGEQIQQAFGDAHLGLALGYSRESEPLGTAGAIRLALDQVITDTLLVLNGDSFCAADLAQFVRRYRGSGQPAGMLLTEVPDCARYGRVELEASNRVRTFLEKDGRHRAGLINAGIYLIPRHAFADLPPGEAISLERELIPDLLRSGIYGWPTTGPFIDIGTPESFAAASAFFAGEQ